MNTLPGVAAHPGRRPVPLAERFWSKVDRSGECWLWTGARDHAGYGIFCLEGRPHPRWVGAHRVAWMLEHGEIPAAAVAMHTCDNPRCVRPDHLRLGSQSENLRDCFAKGRHPWRTYNPAGRRRKEVQS